MGQYWVVVDLDGRTQVRLGKLGETLPYERTTSEFISYLRIPTKKTRPGSPSKEQVRKWLVLCTQNTHRARTQECRGVDQEVATSQLHSIRPSIQAMPVEIRQLIFDMLEEFADVLCLALTNEEMFRSGETRILATSKESVPWAGHRLICVGDYLDNDDIPDGLLTPEEQEELNQKNEYGLARTILIYFLALKFPRVEKRRPLDIFSFYKQFKLDGAFFGSRINYNVFADIAKWLDDKSSIDTAKPEDQLILRNLTKKQYVRDDPTSTTLGTVLLARICWSSDPSRSMAYEGDELTRGVWAGDRFDITTVDRLEEDESISGSWTDVSKEVHDEMARILESEFGPEWRSEYRCY